MMRNKKKHETRFYSPFKENTKKQPKLKYVNKDGNMLTACNLLSVLQGAGSLAIPFAIIIGGYLVILNIIVIGLVTLYSSIILNKCLYWQNLIGRHESYTELANRVWSRCGVFLLSVLQIIHFQFECVLYALLVSNLFDTQFKDVIGSKTYATFMAGLMLVPTMFFKNRKQITWLNFASLLFSFIAFVLLTGNAILHVDRWRFSQIPVFSRWGFWIANGIVLLSFSVHPHSVRFKTQMKHAQYFKRTSTVSFSFSIIFKLVFGIVLAVYIASSEHPTNLNKGFRLLLICCLAFIGYYSFTLPSASIAYLIEHLNIDALDYVFPSARLHARLEWPETFAHFMIRAVNLFITIFIAAVLPDFCWIAALAGSSTSFILCILLPCWFSCKLNGKVYLGLNLIIMLTGVPLTIAGVVFIFWRMHDVNNIADISKMV